MIDFLLGFWTADFLLSLVFYFKKEIIIGLDKKFALISIIVDTFLLALLLFIKYAQRKLRKS